MENPISNFLFLEELLTTFIPELEQQSVADGRVKIGERPVSSLL